jgi:hypothetical protein
MWNKIQIPQTRKQLEEMRAKLSASNDPNLMGSISYIDMLLVDVDKGIAECAKEIE